MTAKSKQAPVAVSSSPDGVAISHINYDGAVKQTEADEYIEITNRGSSPADISGYKVYAGRRKEVFIFPQGTVLRPGNGVRLYTDRVVPETGGFSVGSRVALWNNKGDVGTLAEASGKVISSYMYGNKVVARPSTADTWDRVRNAWPGFEFMWDRGSTEEEIAAAEARLGIKLQPRIRELMSACSGATLPQGERGTFAAEVCLVGVKSWKRAMPQLVESLSWNNATANDHVLIGENVHMVDYGYFVALRVSTGDVYNITWNTSKVESMGSFETWLSEVRPGDDLKNQGKIYPELLAAMGEGPEWLARNHGTYMGWAALDLSDRKAQWAKVEPMFIEAVRRLCEGASP